MSRRRLEEGSTNGMPKSCWESSSEPYYYHNLYYGKETLFATEETLPMAMTEAEPIDLRTTFTPTPLPHPHQPPDEVVVGLRRQHLGRLSESPINSSGCSGDGGGCCSSEEVSSTTNDDPCHSAVTTG